MVFITVASGISIFAQLRTITEVTEALATLTPLAKNTQYLAHDINAFLLGHEEHRLEFEQHQGEFKLQWQNFIDHQMRHGGTPEEEKPVVEAISRSSESYFAGSLALFIIYDRLQLQRSSLNQKIEETIQEVTRLQDFHTKETGRLKLSTAKTSQEKNDLLAELASENTLVELLINLHSFGAITDQNLLGNKIDQSKVAQITAAFRSTVQTYSLHLHSHSSLSPNKPLSIEAIASRFEAVESDITGLSKSQRLIDNQWQKVDQIGDRLDGLISNLLTTHNAEITTASTTANTIIGLVILVTILLSAGAALILANIIAKPITQLKQAARSIGKGDYRHRILIDSNDEIGALGKAFNQMTDDIENYQAELKGAQEDLMRNERFVALGTLITTISHEIRNPLATIKASIYAIRKRLSDQGFGLEKTLERAERSIDRCDNIIEELLDFTRTPELELKATNIDEWIEKILEDQEIDPTIKLSCQLNSNTEILLDQVRFQSCLANIVNNACQAMIESEDDDAMYNLTILSSLDNQQVKISVADTGPGISSDNIEKIFEPMFSTRAFGVGLGLPIVKKIMGQHNGRVEINSLLGEGTTVTLWLPVKISEEI